MIERIREILKTRNLSPTQFADLIGVGRPIVSHILSGRNKPSLEVVQRIIAALPDLALPWLLSGEGPMLAAQIVSSPGAAFSAPVAPPAPGFDTNRRDPAKRADKPRNPAPSAAAFPEAPIAPPAASDSPAVHPVGVVGADAGTSEAVSLLPPPEPTSAKPANGPSIAPVAGSLPVGASVPVAPLAAAKAIRRIVIFYHDGTFVDYRPE